MHEVPDLENEGETTWYTPMSCEKIQMHLPQLCKKNKDCEKINNLVGVLIIIIVKRG